MLRVLALAVFLLVGMLVLTSCGGGGGSVGMSSPLVAYWPANGNYNDVVGGNNGTPFGGVTFAAGFIGQAFSFNGSTGRVFIPDSQSLALTHSIAITAWIDPAAYPPQFGEIFFRGDDRGGYDPYSFYLNSNGTIGFNICDQNNDNVSVTSASTVPLNTWTLVACSLNDTTGVMSVYINGTLAGTTTTNIRPFANLDPTENPGEAIGNFQSANDSAYFDGMIDEVKVYNAAWPAALLPPV